MWNKIFEREKNCGKVLEFFLQNLIQFSFCLAMIFAAQKSFKMGNASHIQHLWKNQTNLCQIDFIFAAANAILQRCWKLQFAELPLQDPIHIGMLTIVLLLTKETSENKMFRVNWMIAINAPNTNFWFLVKLFLR